MGLKVRISLLGGDAAWRGGEEGVRFLYFSATAKLVGDVRRDINAVYLPAIKADGRGLHVAFLQDKEQAILLDFIPVDVLEAHQSLFAVLCSGACSDCACAQQEQEKAGRAGKSLGETEAESERLSREAKRPHLDVENRMEKAEMPVRSASQARESKEGDAGDAWESENAEKENEEKDEQNVKRVKVGKACSEKQRGKSIPLAKPKGPLDRCTINPKEDRAEERRAESPQLSSSSRASLFKKLFRDAA